MNTKKTFNILMAFIFSASLLFGSGQVNSATAAPASPVDESKVPHYFGPYPNWANSPLTMPDATITITGNGTGATAEATVGANGAITAITVTDPGHGYTNAKVDITGAGTGAMASAVIVRKGSVVKVTVDTPGTGYTAPVVTFSGNGGAAATAYGGVEGVFVSSGGSGYTMPTVEFDLPDGPDGIQAKGHAEMDANGTITAVIVDSPGSGYSFAPGVAIHDGTLFDPIVGATLAQATTTLSIQSIGLDAFGSNYINPPAVTISDPTGTGATATAVLDNGIISAITILKTGSGYLTPGMRKFVDTLPGLTDAGINNLGQYLPVAVPDTTTFPGTDYYVIAVVQHREQMHSDLPPTLLREYVQLATNVVPGKQVALQTSLVNGTINPTLMPDGSQAIGVDQPHFLGPVIVAQKDRAVRITFYNLLPSGADGDLFLPVDSTFMGSGMGNVKDAQGNYMMEGYDPRPTTNGTVMDEIRNPMCDQYPKPMGCYKDNRATLHLHGGITPWISDGTPHQWITPANEMTPYPQGVSVQSVPDMIGQAAIDAGVPDCNAPDDGCSTFYYTNQQSARLMFYHDHAWGITRLNVYAGEAAGYLIQDPVEDALVANGTIPADQIPLVIQDRTFLPDAAQLALQDPTWDAVRWGSKGNFWYQHVYMPAQNPNDPSGMSAYGRWMYGAWFWPPQADLKYGPIDNPYYNMDPKGPDGILFDDPTTTLDESADNWSTQLVTPCTLDDPATWQYDTDPFCEPPQIPGTTLLSAGMEQFNDTPIVNGTAYPTVTLEPKSYRLRILNAANDRFWNLQWYVGDPTTASTDVNGLGEVIGATEVALKANEVAAAQLDPAGVFPTPDLNLSPAGPDWIQIGTEGGFLPKPVVVDGQQVTTWITDPTRFDVGNVDQHSLLIAPAERADVIVDFSQFAGQTLILYNDAPAAFPARVPSYDYFTGYPDQWPNGPSTILPGYGPNTRTIMQVKIAGAPAPAFNLNTLNNAFLHKANGSGVFESSQHPIIVGQAAYNSAYGTNFAASGNCTDLNGTNKCDGFLRINQYGNQPLRFDSLRMGSTGYQQPQVMIEPKAIHDEMNSTTFDQYGRMTANLGIETTPPTPGLTNFNPMPYVYPSNAIIDATNLPKNDPDNPDFKVTPIASNDDGTQIWRITHNGVDTHPIHFHLYDVQLLNRVTWDNIIIPPDQNELGWKDTIRVSPLEDTIVALRPIIPKLPWEIPNSVRALSPMDPLFDGVNPLEPQIGDHGVLASATLADLLAIGIPPSNGQAEPVDIVNHLVNFGWEYVYHCHILSHEEMDMMQPVSVAYPPLAPSGLTFANGTLSWNDNSVAETAYVIQVSRDGVNWTEIGRIDVPLAPGPNSTGPMSYILSAFAGGDQYRVVAENTVGDTFNYANPNINEIVAPATGFPHITVTSNSEVVIVGEPAPAAPTDLTATLDTTVPQVNLAWTDNATTETSYEVYRSDNGGVFALITTLAADSVSYADTTVASGNHYEYQVAAVNTGGSSYSNFIAVDWTGATPAAPTNLAATVLSATQVQLDWIDNALNETGYIVERSDNGGAFAVIATLAADSVTYLDETVGAGNSYTYQVAATNVAGQSGYSNPATVDIFLPDAPVNLSATNISRTGFTFNWGYPFPQPDGFEIQIASNSNFTTIVQSFPDVAADSTSLAISGLTRNTRYYVRIQAFNAVGIGPWSQTLQVRTSK